MEWDITFDAIREKNGELEVKVVGGCGNPHEPETFQKTFEPIGKYIHYEGINDAITNSKRKPSQKKAALKAEKILAKINNGFQEA